MMKTVAQLKNIGPKTASWLADVGIKRLDDLEEVGAVAAYLRLKRSRSGVTVVALYALQAAILDIHWHDLTPDMKADLRRQAETWEAKGDD